MGKIKEHYYDEINSREDDMIDDELLYDEYIEEELLDELAEEAEFMNIFYLTHTYPM